MSFSPAEDRRILIGAEQFTYPFISCGRVKKNSKIIRKIETAKGY